MGFRTEGQRILAPRLAATAEDGAETLTDTLGEIEVKDYESFLADRQAWAQRHAAAQVKRVDENLRELIRRRVARATERGTPPRALGRELRELLGGKSARHRAERIARTELHRAAMFGQHSEAVRLNRRTGQKYVKVWRSTRDPRTRISHRRADGQTVPLEETFTVGGVQLRHPGDPQGPAKETINCRCTMTIVPERAASLDGQPVISRTPTRVRAQLGQQQLEGRPLDRVLDLQRGGDLGPKSAPKLYDAMAREAVNSRRSLAAPRTMNPAERAAFERLGRRKGVEIIRDPNLAEGAIAAHPRPPMIMQLVSEVDDQLLFNDLLTLLFSGLDEGIGAAR